MLLYLLLVNMKQDMFEHYLVGDWATIYRLQDRIMVHYLILNSLSHHSNVFPTVIAVSVAQSQPRYLVSY